MISKADWGVIIHFANVCPRLFWHSKLKVAEQWMEAALRAVHTLGPLCNQCKTNISMQSDGLKKSAGS